MPVSCELEAGVPGPQTYLRLIECGLINLLLERFGNCLLLEHLVLAEQKPVLEREFSEREAEDELLPWEERAVEPASQALHMISKRSHELCNLEN